MVDLRKTHPFDPERIQEVPEELYAEIGCRLVLLQSLEMYIAYTAKVVFAKNAQKAKDAILNADVKTLGNLIGILRKNVSIDGSFDDCLKRTLEARNLFVHEFSHKFDIHTEVGVQQAIKFLEETFDDLEEVTQTMKAAAISFARDRGLSDAKFEEYWRKNGDLSELESRYIPRLSKLLVRKSTQT